VHVRLCGVGLVTTRTRMTSFIIIRQLMRKDLTGALPAVCCGTVGVTMVII
jgi:hypothetical protein